VENLPPEIVDSAYVGHPSSGGDVDLDTLMRHHILDTFRRHDGNKARTARALGIGRRTVYRLLEKYGISEDGGEN
jgi:DNA-binding NtrC family response regulator